MTSGNQWTATDLFKKKKDEQPTKPIDVTEPQNIGSAVDLFKKKPVVQLDLDNLARRKPLVSYGQAEGISAMPATKPTPTGPPEFKSKFTGNYTEEIMTQLSTGVINGITGGIAGMTDFTQSGQGTIGGGIARGVGELAGSVPSLMFGAGLINSGIKLATNRLPQAAKSIVALATRIGFTEEAIRGAINNSVEFYDALKTGDVDKIADSGSGLIIDSAFAYLMTKGWVDDANNLKKLWQAELNRRVAAARNITPGPPPQIEGQAPGTLATGPFPGPISTPVPKTLNEAKVVTSNVPPPEVMPIGPTPELEAKVDSDDKMIQAIKQIKQIRTPLPSWPPRTKLEKAEAERKFMAAMPTKEELIERARKALEAEKVKEIVTTPKGTKTEVPVPVVTIDPEVVRERVIKDQGGPEGLLSHFTDEGLRKATGYGPRELRMAGLVERTVEGNYKLTDILQSKIQRVSELPTPIEPAGPPLTKEEVNSKIETPSKKAKEKPPKSVKQPEKPSGKAYHGTDFDRLESILADGLRAGSALDFTSGREWAREYPIQLELTDVKPGEYVPHNDYYRSAKTARVSKVTVELDQYTADGAEKALDTINALKKQYPDVKWVIKGKGPDKTELTTKNVAKLFETKYGLPADEALTMAKQDMEDPWAVETYRLETKKQVRNIEEYSQMLDWYASQAPEQGTKAEEAAAVTGTQLDEIARFYNKDIDDLTDKDVTDYLAKATNQLSATPAVEKPKEPVETTDEDIEKFFNKPLDQITEEEMDRYFGLAGEEPPPKTDTHEVDIRIGAKEQPELVEVDSIFRQTKDVTISRTAMYQNNKSIASSVDDALRRLPDRPLRDITVTTWKLINDVNRWLDGENVDISNVRDFLSDIAVRADEFRPEIVAYSGSEVFDDWKSLVSDMAVWAKRINKFGVLEEGNDAVIDTAQNTINEIRGRKRGKKPNGSEFEDLVQESRIKQPWEESKKEELEPIETEFTLDKANILPTLLKDISNQNPSRTLIYELMQNSLDAFENGPGSIEIYHEMLGASQGSKLTFVDNGVGMTPMQVKKFFLVGGSIGKSGTTTRGGYGQAKVPLLLIPNKIKLTTWREGIRSDVVTNRDEIVSGKITITPTRDDKGVGTRYEAWLPRDIIDSQITDFSMENAMENIVKGCWTDSKIRYFTKGYYDSQYTERPLIFPGTLDKAAKKFPSDSFEMDGSKVSIHYVKTEPYGFSYTTPPSYSLEGIFTNKGLIVDISSSIATAGSSLPVKPDFKIVVDFELTPDVRAPEYPFLKNRTEVKHKFSEKIVKLVSDKIQKHKEGLVIERGAKFKEMFDNSPSYNGVKVLIPYFGKRFDDAKDIIDKNSDVISDFCSVVAEFTGMIANIGERNLAFHITIDPKVYGYKTDKALTGVELYAINPFALTRRNATNAGFSASLLRGDTIIRLQADAMAHALLHEFAHLAVFSHNESYTLEFARLAMSLGAEKIYKLQQLFEVFYELHGKRIASIDRDFKDLLQSGTGLEEITDVLSIQGLAVGGEDGIRDVEKKARAGEELNTDEIIQLGSSVTDYIRMSDEIKKLNLMAAKGELNYNFVRAIIDRSGNIRRDLIKQYEDDGFKVVRDMVLSKGASAWSASNYRQFEKEVYGGLSKEMTKILDAIVFSDRMLDIADYKTEREFRFPKPVAAFSLYRQLYRFKGFNKWRNLTDEEVAILEGDGKTTGRIELYFEGMQKVVNDAYDNHLITSDEKRDLLKHKYRRIGKAVPSLADIFDRRLIKPRDVTRSIYDSGVQALARGQETDILERSGKVMALEIMNRIYGRIANNRANLSAAKFARENRGNPFVFVRETKEQLNRRLAGIEDKEAIAEIRAQNKVPTGWTRAFYYEDGKRKSMWLSPIMVDEWLAASSDMTSRLMTIVKWASGAPITRALATGIEFSFALANVPRDVMQLWFASRTYEEGKWNSVYSPVAPYFVSQLSQDISEVWGDAWLRKGDFKDYIEDLGGMEFLVLQGRLFKRGREVAESTLGKVMDVLGYLGETSEILTRLAIRRRAIKNAAKAKGILYEEAARDPEIRRNATFAARDYMDFSQGGWLTKALDQVSPYLNAGMVGTRTFVRSFKPGEGTAKESVFKLMQFATVIVGLYIAMKLMTPKTHEALRNDPRSQNNIILPLGDILGFEDDMGEVRYPFFMIPLDQNLRFFKKLFEASTDMFFGDPVDAQGTANALTEMSPVGMSNIPPTLSSSLKYFRNTDTWLARDVWRKSEALPWPKSKEEWLPGITPEQYVALGAKTGISPERAKSAIESLIPANSTYSYLAGKGYQELFGKLSKSQRKQHLAEILANFPLTRRFIGITRPSGPYMESIQEAKDQATFDKLQQDNGLDLRAIGFLYGRDYTRDQVMQYIHSYKDYDTERRLTDRFEFAEKAKAVKLTNMSYWMSMKSLQPEARAKAYVERWNATANDPKKRRAFNEEIGKVMTLETFAKEQFSVFSRAFMTEVSKLKIK